MKKALFLILILLGSIITYPQSKNIAGAWLWQDSKTSFSLFINEDSTIAKHTGPVNEPILDKNLKRGTYRLKDNQKLLITWADRSTETGSIKFIDNFTLQIQFKTPGTNVIKTYIFKKIIDEEVEVKDN